MFCALSGLPPGRILTFRCLKGRKSGLPSASKGMNTCPSPLGLPPRSPGCQPYTHGTRRNTVLSPLLPLGPLSGDCPKNRSKPPKMVVPSTVIFSCLGPNRLFKFSLPGLQCHAKGASSLGLVYVVYFPRCQTFGCVVLILCALSRANSFAYYLGHLARSAFSF